MKRSFLFAVCLAVACLGGCAHAAKAPSAVSPDLAKVGSEAFIVRPGNVLRIRVWPDAATVSGDYPVEETGAVFVPNIGQVNAGGQKIGSLRAEMRQKYEAAGFKNTVVTITPLFRVSVLGAVSRPGQYQVDPTQTLYDAISVAGGFAQNANQGDVRLARDAQVYRINATDSLAVSTGAAGVQLASGDRIIVPATHRVFTYGQFREILQFVIVSLTAYRVFKRL